MADKMTYEDFSRGLNPFDLSFVAPMHEYLTQNGCKAEVKPAAQGPVLSYLMPKAKKTILNYVFRKNGMQVRIYGDGANTYQDFLQTLPDIMIAEIDKATNCRLCNARCPKGYAAVIKGNEYFKCRYGAFMFGLNPETQAYIKAFIENEVNARNV